MKNRARESRADGAFHLQNPAYLNPVLAGEDLAITKLHTRHHKSAGQSPPKAAAKMPDATAGKPTCEQVKIQARALLKGTPTDGKLPYIEGIELAIDIVFNKRDDPHFADLHANLVSFERDCREKGTYRRYSTLSLLKDTARAISRSAEADYREKAKPA